MKKISMALVAFLVLCACSSEQKELKYRGLSMALPFQTFIDSMQTRGFAVDSAKTDSAFTRVVMANPAEKFRLMLAQKDGKAHCPSGELQDLHQRQYPSALAGDA